MTTKAHKNLSGVDLHEPKGIELATLDQVYRADGSGSGSWQDITIPSGLFRVSLVSFTSSGTWTKPSGLFQVVVHVCSEGGASASAGGSASFGAHCSATGGGLAAGSAGTGSSGHLNLTGVVAVAGLAGSTFPGGAGASPFPTKGIGGNSDSGTGVVGGSGGGYARKVIATASLGATETITIAATGAANGFVLVEEYISV